MTDAGPEAPGKHLALVGGRGCGKTSAAAWLAREYPAFRLLDLDALIVEEAQGRAVAEIVSEEGWRGFRDREYRVLERVTASAGPGVGVGVVDCGGGIVVDLDDAGLEIYSERKVEILRNRCRVVYLRCASDLLAARIAGDPNRPPLSDYESFHGLMDRRDGWYRRAADRVIEADARSSEDLAGEIARWFFDEGGGESPGAGAP
jgi:shikimate kinase